MKRVRILVHSEESDLGQAVLVAQGIRASFVRRGSDGDTLSVPAKEAARAKRLLAELSR